MAPQYDRHLVTAVLVTHKGASWLPDTLKALLTQTHPVDRLVAADTGDSAAGMLTEVVGEGNLLTLPPETGFGEAVAQALAHPASSVDVPGEPDRTEWVWLVHDDSTPEQNALEHLLATAESHPPAVILGPKLRDWNDRRVLLETGVAIDRAGRRETRLDRRELDQGQHDTIREVMAVSTAGMLIRRDVWDELGGLDPAFGLFRDDIDLGWRAYAAGHRVLIAPDAVMYHAEASARGLREVAIAADDRRNALLALFANLPLSTLALSLPRNAFGTLLRTLLFLATRRPNAARAELAAFGGALRATPRLRRGRTHRPAHSVVSRFQPRWNTLRRLPDLVRDGLHPSLPAALPSASPDALRRWLRRPAVLLTLALTAVALVAGRHLLVTGGRLDGGALVPAYGGASDLWVRYVSGWHPAGLGSAAGSPPYVGVLAVLSTLLLGKPWLAVWALLLFGVPLAGLTAYVAVRRVLPGDTFVAVWAGATYALLPVATGAVATGRFGTVAVAVLLPPAGLFAHRMLAPDARHAAWAGGLLLAVATAFVPLTWVLVAVVGLFARYALGQRIGRRLAIMLGVPPLLLLPWALHLVAHPSGMLREAGLAVGAEPEPRTLLMLGPGGPGTPAVWVTAGLAVTGLAALLLRRRRMAVLAGWLFALSGMLVAILEVAARAWPGAALTFAAAGVLLAACCMLRRAVVVMLGRGRGRLRMLARGGALAIVAAATSTPLLAAVSWTAGGSDAALGRAGRPLPVFVDALAAHPRMLVLRQTAPGTVASTVLRDRLPVPGDEAIGAPAPARERLHAVVAGLATGTGRANPLARFGVRYVIVPRPAGDPLVRTLDAAPDLARLSRTRDFALWEVTAPAGRLLLFDRGTVTPLPTGQVDARVTIPPGPAGRTLLLAEPADGGWHATLDGAAPPSRTVDGWAQAYDVPSTGGVFTLRRGMRLRHIWVMAQALALIVVVLLALPTSRVLPRPPQTRPRGRRRRTTPALPGPRRSEPAALTAGAHRRRSDVDEPSEAGT